MCARSNTYYSKMYEVNPQLHDAGVCFLYGDVTVLIPVPQVREARRHEVRQVVLHHAPAGHLDWDTTFM